MTKTDKLNTKLNKSSSDFLFNSIVDFLENKILSEKSAKWISKDIKHSFFSDLCFIYKKNVFSVLLDKREQADKISIKEDAIKFHLSESKKNGFKSCIFPVIIKGGQIKFLSDGWNLFDTETNTPINPDDIKSGRKQELSDWGLECYGVNYLKEYLESQGCNMISIQTTDRDEPQIWYNDENGDKSYVIVHIQNIDDDIDSDEITNEIINKYIKHNGYEATLSVSPIGKSKSLYYGDDFDISIDYFIRINKAQTTESVKQSAFEDINIYKLIESTFDTKNISDKKYIKIYYLKGYEDYVLKTHSAIVSNIDIITNELVAIPYKYEDRIKDNPHYGLPLYYITGKSSKYANFKEIDPQDEDLVKKLKTNILKRISGENITYSYRYQFFTLYGEFSDKNPSRDLQKVIDIKNKYGINMAASVVNRLNQGVYNYAPNQFKKGSAPYKFVPNLNFSLIYQSFKEHYLNSLRLLSEFPQLSYDNALMCIVEPKNFVFDFSTPSNIIADYNAEQFGFINFIFDKLIVEQTNSDTQINQFKNALLGIYENISFQPYEILFLQDDMNRFKEYKKIILEKVENAVKNVC